MKETYYFPHDYNARNDIKLAPIRAKHGMAGYGVVFGLFEMLYEEGGSIALASLDDVSFSFGVAKEFVEEIVKNYKIFKNDGANFWSESVNRRLKEREEKRNKYAEAGRKGGVQSGLNRSDAKAMLNDSQRFEAKERKGKERKEEEKKDLNKLNKIIAPEISNFQNPPQYSDERKKLFIFLKGLMPFALARVKVEQYCKSYSDKEISKALSNSSCVGESGFIKCAEYYKKLTT